MRSARSQLMYTSATYHTFPRAMLITVCAIESELAAKQHYGAITGTTGPMGVDFP